MVHPGGQAATDVAVLGAGPGGYVAALRLAHLGKKVTLIDPGEHLGGVCLNEGCIPSKALIHAASLFHRATHAEQLGIALQGRVDMAGMQRWKQGVVDRLARGVAALCSQRKVTVVKDSGRFVASDALQLSSGRLTFGCAIVATGSVPVQLPNLPFGHDVLDAKQALELTEIPKSLAVVGGGYIGLELSTVYAKLGAKVTVVEMMPQLLPGMDAELAKVVLKRLEQLGVAVHLNAKAEGFQQGVLRFTGGEAPAEKVLVAVGRKPNADIGLESTGAKRDGKGFIQVDEHCRTADPRIFAVGDVTGQPMLAHRASAMGKVAAETICGIPSSMANRVIPAVAFTDPEVASVGLTEQDARLLGMTVKTAAFPLRGLGRALTLGESEGFIRLVADEKGRLIGAHIAAPEASELINEASLAVQRGVTLEELSLTVHQHPTLSEGLVEAAEAALGRAIHAIMR